MYELKIKNNNNYLGMLWEILNPAIQISVYWIVFGMGMRNNSNVGDVPFLQWLVAGIVIWFFISPAILQGSKSIYTRIKIISKMNFPLSVIPSYVIFSILYPNAMLLGIIAVIFQFTDKKISLYYLQLPYYMLAAVALVFSLSLITSTLSTIVRDVQMFVQSIMRMLFYVTPILWNPFENENLPKFLLYLVKANPFTYIVEGFRDALLSRGWFFENSQQSPHLEYTLYFWGLVLVLFLIGSTLHVKLRNRFVDYL